MNCFVTMPKGKPHCLEVVAANGNEHEMLDILINNKDIMLEIEIKRPIEVGSKPERVRIPSNKLRLAISRLKKIMDEISEFEEKKIPKGHWTLIEAAPECKKTCKGIVKELNKAETKVRHASPKEERKRGG